MTTAGIDGCRGGWVAVSRNGDGLHAEFFRHVSEIEAAHPDLQVAAIDMPIGLLGKPEPGGRLCDRLARRGMGRRASSVFSPPSRDMLQARGYEDVRRRGLTIQAFNLIPRIRELDAFMTPERQRVFREAHPELAFARLNGEPLHHSKRTPEGHHERLSLLDDVDFDALRLEVPRKFVADNDLLDALVLCHVAERIRRGESECLPQDPPRDERGLLMEIRC